MVVAHQLIVQQPGKFVTWGNVKTYSGGKQGIGQK